MPSAYLWGRVNEHERIITAYWISFLFFLTYRLSMLLRTDLDHSIIFNFYLSKDNRYPWQNRLLYLLKAVLITKRWKIKENQESVEEEKSSKNSKGYIFIRDDRSPDS